MKSFSTVIFGDGRRGGSRPGVRRRSFGVMKSEIRHRLYCDHRCRNPNNNIKKSTGVRKVKR